MSVWLDARAGHGYTEIFDTEDLKILDNCNAHSNSIFARTLYFLFIPVLVNVNMYKLKRVEVHDLHKNDAAELIMFNNKLSRGIH